MIWKVGLLKKAAEMGVKGRLWLYIRKFVIDRKYYIRVNDFISPVLTSKVGIPQGPVISLLLCYLYTHDTMKDLDINHTEYADDDTIWYSDSDLKVVEKVLGIDIGKIDGCCDKWNTGVAAEKTNCLNKGKSKGSLSTEC